MAATPSTTTEKVAPLAMRLVARYWLDHDLPTPLSIHRPVPCPAAGARAVRVDISADDLDAWLEATSAEYVGTETAIRQGSRVAVVTNLGRAQTELGEVPVLIRIIQRCDSPVVPRRFSLVGGASA